MKTVTASADCDPRHQGWPCQGRHRAGPQRQNQYAAWQSCTTCGIRLRYVPKGSYHGETRAVGPTRDLVLQAQEELQQEFHPAEMTERIFNAKLMEVKGRTLVANRGRGRMAVQVRANEELGQLMIGETVETKPVEYKPMTPVPKAKIQPGPKKIKDKALETSEQATSSEGSVIPPGTTVVSKAASKSVKVKTEQVEQSVPAVATMQSTPVINVDAGDIVIEDSEEDSEFEKVRKAPED